MRKHLLSAGFALLVATTFVSISVMTPPAFASEIKYVVNDIPLTTGDIAHRTAFLRLQHKKGDAGEEMIEQTLRMAEAKRLGIRISDAQVEAAYQRFAQNNKMQVSQLDGIMEKSGVTKDHFKEYIRAQMAWSQAVSARYRSGDGAVSEQDVVKRMLEKKGSKPSATEYMLQQVIFVVPPAERNATLAKRKREADAMRARFNGCNTTREFAKGLVDVTVRDLPRVLAPQLPPDWAEQIKATKLGGATPVRETERGVEFIGICSSREVSDDKVAQMVFQGEGSTDKNAEDLSKKYMDELKAKARIVKR